MPPRLAAVLLFCAAASAQSLPGTAPLSTSEDPAAEIVSGIGRYLQRIHAWFAERRDPDPRHLRLLLGAVDPRLEPVAMEPVGTTDRSPVLAATDSFELFAVRWPALEGVHGEGLYLRQLSTPRHLVIFLPGPDRLPEQCQEMFEFAAAGADVLVPVQLRRSAPPPPAPGGWAKHLGEREWIRRMGFPLGRHPLGFEVQKVIAAVEWWKQRHREAAVFVTGVSDGAWVAQFAAVLEPRIARVEALDGSIEPAGPLEQPLDRIVFALVRFFGDRDLRGLLRSRLAAAPRLPASPVRLPSIDAEARAARQVRELEDFLQRLARRSRRVRDELWSNIRGATPGEWRRAAAPLERRIREEVIGELPAESCPSDPRSRLAAETPLYRAWDVRLNVRPEFPARGVLLLPARIEAGARLPLIVVQHGLQGSPQDLFGQSRESRAFATYRNYAETLVREGFAVYLPQNPYTGDFRWLVRLAHPLGLTLFSFIREQYRVALDWLSSLPMIDPERIGFYGLSYGGKTALRVPPFDPRFRAVVCAGDFNEWIGKLTTTEEPWSYLFTDEYDVPEWNLAHIASHAELAMLIAPRPFLVERGHRDGVGIDEWVLAEFARVRRFYDETSIGERAAIAFFNGPHRIDGEEALRFFRRWLSRP
jgi:dienelactone hydrolase